MHVLSPRARAQRIGWIALLVVVLVLSAVPASAKRKKDDNRRYRLPVSRRWMPDWKVDNKHHDYPAWDLAVPRHTAVRAVHGGRVVSVTRWGGCGRGVIIGGRDGYSYTYCHGSHVFIRKGRKVEAGEKIMLSGSSGHSTGPHLHLQIAGRHGRLLCPQPLLAKWTERRDASPRKTTSRGCSYSPDRAIYRSHRQREVKHKSARPGRRAERAKQRSHRAGGDRNGKKARKGDRRNDEKRKARTRSARKDRRPGRGKAGRKNGRKERGRPKGRITRKQRVRQHRRRARMRVVRVRRATAARRGDLALARRVRPLI